MTLNISHVTGSPIVFFSALATGVGWLTLTVGTVLSGFHGLVWWVICYELALYVSILYVLMKATYPDYRLLIQTSLAISITLLTQIIDTHLHVGQSSAKASAGGAIVIVTMQFFWTIVFGSAPDSWIHGAIYGLPSATIANAKYYDKEGAMPLSASYADSHDSVHSGLSSSPLVTETYSPQLQQVYTVSQPSPTTTAPAANQAVALHSYTANPSDPNEISFQKDEILDVLDRRGNWWQARKQDGTIGIVPSNYVSTPTCHEVG
ncbi:hypothetical protein DM01DRAFT_1402599 [Hesseltinella vesiculosa]|uniref:SH3 domain-containing protein n=1 Tax=Hesseltinella vesiculosa TaxID=101127 RepID=A0A1X2GM25_9FUNG|nr:hypothetical protein DM01DRAFT_1402599 [Hesseltinella vesiculosa]